MPIAQVLHRYDDSENGDFDHCNTDHRNLEGCNFGQAQVRSVLPFHQVDSNVF